MGDIPWGKRIEGKVYVECIKCGHKHWYDLDEQGEIIAEVIGLICPGCGKIISNKVFEWERSKKLDNWFK